MEEQKKVQQKTSDLNFVAFLAAKGKEAMDQVVTFQDRRPRVWFIYDMEPEEFKKWKSCYFCREEKSSVPALKLFEERDRVYAIMTHKRQEAEG